MKEYFSMELRKATLEMVAFPDDCAGATLTNRLIPGDEEFSSPEWAEYGKIAGIPVVVYYRTTPEDQFLVDENGGDWGAVDWEDRVDRIEVDVAECDNQEISDSAIAALSKKLN